MPPNTPWPWLDDSSRTPLATCEQQVERGGADTATWRAIHATARDLSTLVLSLAGQSHDLDWAEIDGR